MDAIHYRIGRIETRQFAMFENAYKASESVNVHTSFSFSLNKEQNSIRCITGIQYTQADQLILVLEIACFFLIEPEGIQALQDEHKIPVDFLRYMGTIVVGTARGILHVKTEGTSLNKVVLPPLNLVAIIKKDFIIQ